MVSADEVERLSQLLAGDLSASDEAALRAELSRRPELEQAFHRLKALEALTASLGAPAPGDVAAAQQAAEQLTRASPRLTWRPLAAAALAGAALAAGLTAWLMPSEAPPVTAPVAQAPAVAPRPVLDAPKGRLELYDDAQVTPLSSGVFRLDRGNVLAVGQLSVEVLGRRVDVDGEVLLAMEPEKAEAHVRAPMNRQLLAGTAVVLFVMSGSAKAEEPRAQGQPPPAIFEVKSARPNVPMAEVPKPSQMLSVKEVNAAVVPRTEAIGRCFEQALKGDPKLQGKLTLLLTLKSDGKKSRLREGTVAGDYSLQNPFVASCVLEALANVDFPAPKGADEVQLAYPLEFQPRGTGSVGSWVLLPDDGESDKRLVMMNDRAERVQVEIGDAPQTLTAGAKVTVVEFSELGCPFCERGEQVMKRVRDRYKGKVNFVFKHHPLKSDPQAETYARAMVAAHRMGRFWEYHDQLYASGGDPRSVAQRLGFDLEQFDRLRGSEETFAAVQRDVAQAEALGSKGIPSYFVNGREVVGVRAYEEMRKLIDDELRAASK